VIWWVALGVVVVVSAVWAWCLVRAAGKPLPPIVGERRRRLVGLKRKSADGDVGAEDSTIEWLGKSGPLR